MNITTKDVVEFNAIVSRHIVDGAQYILDDEATAEDNSKFEAEYVGKQPSICSAKEANILEGRMDMESLKSTMGEQFYNYEVMRVVGCSTYAIFHGIQESTGNIARSDALKSDIRNLHRIGDPSAYGDVISGDIGGAKDMYAIKTAKTESGETDLTHELAIALLRINSMRKLVPNMAMVYAGTRCSPPIVNEAGVVTSFCSAGAGPDVVPYVIYENIYPSESFNSVITKCSMKKFLSLLIQVCKTTDIASKAIGYTHYDSHGGNWLDRKINVNGVTDGPRGEFLIPYTDFKTNKVSYVLADSVATVIDYGMATVDYEDRRLGSHDVGLQAYGVIQGPWPLHDIYKLFMFLANKLVSSKSNPSILAKMRKIFTFFNKTESLEAALIGQREMYFFLPPTQDTVVYTIQDFLDHLGSVCDLSEVLFDKPGNIPVLECTTCSTFLGTVNGAYIRNPQPTDFLEFYDMASGMGSSSKKDYDAMVTEFDYRKASVEFKAKITASMNKITANLADIKINGPVLPYAIDARSLATPTILKPMTDSYSLLFDTISHYEDVETWIKIGKSVAILYADEDMLSFLNASGQALEKTNKQIQGHIDRGRTNYKKMYPILVSSEWGMYSDKYWWYVSRSGDIVHLVNRFKEDKERLFREERLPSTLIQSKINRTVSTRPPTRQVKLERDQAGKPVGIAVK